MRPRNVPKRRGLTVRETRIPLTLDTILELPTAIVIVHSPSVGLPSRPSTIQSTLVAVPIGLHRILNSRFPHLIGPSNALPSISHQATIRSTSRLQRLPKDGTRTLPPTKKQGRRVRCHRWINGVKNSLTSKSRVLKARRQMRWKRVWASGMSKEGRTLILSPPSQALHRSDASKIQGLIPTASPRRFHTSLSGRPAFSHIITTSLHV